MAKEDDISEVQGQRPAPLDQFWLNFARGMARESVGALEDGAKEIIRLTSLLQGIYFAALTFIRDSLVIDVTTQCLPKWPFAILILAPILFWLLSLVFALKVFIPKTYDTNFESPIIAKDTCQSIIAEKHKQLKRAHLLLLFGFVPLILDIIFYLAWM